MLKEEAVVASAVSIRPAAPLAPSATAAEFPALAPAESKTSSTQPPILLSQLEQSIQDFLRAVQSNVQQRPAQLKPPALLISYVFDKPESEQAVEKLASYLRQAGIPVELMPFTNLAAFNEQLVAHADSNLAIMCTKAYAAAIEANPGLREAIAAFGRNRMDALHTLLYEGGCRDTAFKVVDSHYLVRACQPLLQSQDPLTRLETVVDILLHPSSNAGLGLLPDLLDIEKDVFARERAVYQQEFQQLQAQQQRLTIAYRLQQELHTAYHTHPFQRYLQIQEVIPPEAKQAVDNLQQHPKIKTALLLCKTSADTLLTGLALEKALIDRGHSVISIDCADYPGKAAHHCVHQALQKLKLHRYDRAALAQGVLKSSVVILLKGYEQTGCYDNLYVKNELRRWKDMQVLVTCRADYFQHRGYENCFLPDPTSPDPSTLHVYRLEGFASPEAQALAVSPALQEAAEARRKAQAVEQASQQEALPHPKLQAQQKELTAFLAERHSVLVERGLLKETLDQNPAVFISYAWEAADKTGQPRARQHTYLRRIVRDLTTLGFPTWLDIERMTGDIDEQMAGNIRNSAFALIIDTALYRGRAAIPTNVQKEYQAITAKHAAGKLGVFALQFNQFNAVPHDTPLPFDTLDFSAIDDGTIYIRQLNTVITQLLHLQGEDLIDYQQATQQLDQRLALLPGKHLLVDKGQDDVQAFDIDSRLKDYVKPYGLNRLEDPFDTRFDLEEDFNAFLQMPTEMTKTYVMLGLAGSGKSLFTLSTFKKLLQGWHAWKAGAASQPTFLPIYIPLRNYANEKAEDCIASALTDYGLDETDIEHLRTGMGCGQQILFILDGFDELGKVALPNYPHKLSSWPTAKLLISGRPQPFEEGGRRAFASNPQDPDASRAQQTFVIRGVSPFSPQDIAEYIQRLDPENAEANQRALERLPGLMPLLDNPFLLNLTLQALPRLLESRAGSTQAVKRSDIYGAFIDTLFKKESAKQQEHYDQAAYHQFAQGLAFALFQAKEIAVNPSLSALWQDFFVDPAQLPLREACPLKRSGQEYAFIHKSVYEYFVACRLWAALGQDPETRNVLWNKRLLTEELAVIDFLAEFYTSKRPVCTTPGVTAVEEVKNEEKQPAATDADTALWALIDASKHNPANTTAAASAVTVLNTARVAFTGRDLSHTHLRGADLSNSVCDSTDFSFADLSGVNFQAAWLNRADLTDTNLHDLAFGELPYLQLERGQVAGCAYSPDGRWLAGLGGREIVIYEAATREWVSILEGHTGEVTSVAFSPDSERLVSGSQDSTLRLWSAATGQCEKTLEGHTGEVTSVAFSPNGEQLVSGSNDETIRLWSVETGQCEKILEGHTAKVNAVTFSPNGEQLVSAGGYGDSTLRLWSVATGACQILEGHTWGVNSVAFSPNGEHLVSGSQDSTLRLWSAATGECEKILEGHTDKVLSVAFSPNGQQLASGSWDATLRLWSAVTGQCEKIFEGYTSLVDSVAFTPSGEHLASICGRTLRLWSVPTGTRKKSLEVHTDWVGSVAFSPDGQYLVSGSWDKTLCLWSAATGEFEKMLKGHSDRIRSVAFSPDGQRLVSGSEDKTLRLWLAATGACERILKGHTERVNSVAFSPNGEHLASGSGEDWGKDNTVRLWSVTTGQCEKILEGHTDGVTSIAFSPNGEQLVSAGGYRDKTLRLWSVATGVCQILAGHSSKISSVAFSPNGKHLASGGQDELRLWSIETGQCEKILEGNFDHIAFSPDGRWLAASCQPEMVLRVYSLQPDVFGLEQACQSLSSYADSLSWHQQGDALFLASGHMDASVRYWWCQVVDNQPLLQLLWTSKQNTLMVADAKLDNARDLSTSNFDLLRQGGAKADRVGLTALHMAAECGDLEAVQRLLTENPDDRNAPEANGFTPLAISAQHNHLTIVQALLAAGAGPNIAERNGITPLHSAAQKGYLEVCQALLAGGANPNASAKNKATPLYGAAEEGHLEVVQLLLVNRAEVNAAKRNRSTPLHIAARKDHPAVVQALLAGGADANAADKAGDTPLYLAAEYSRVGIVQALLARGADANAANNEGCTPLYTAARLGRLEVVQALLAGGADANAANVPPAVDEIFLMTGADDAEEDWDKPLFVAAREGHLEIVQALLAGGADAKAANENGTTPLRIAAKNGHLEVVQALLAGGADANAAYKNGTTPLHVAVKSGHSAVVQALLVADADVDAADEDGIKPLFIAAQKGNLEIVQALLAGGADANAVNKDGFTPLFVGICLDHPEVAKVLLAAGADPNIEIGAVTSLIAATWKGHSEVVKALLARGVVNPAAMAEADPLYVIAERGHEAIAQLMLTGGAAVKSMASGFLILAADEGEIEAVKALLAAGANINAAAVDGSTAIYNAAAEGHVEVVEALIAAGADIHFARKDGTTPLTIAARKNHDSIVTLLEEKANSLAVAASDNSDQLEDQAEPEQKNDESAQRQSAEESRTLENLAVVAAAHQSEAPLQLVSAMDEAPTAPIEEQPAYQEGGILRSESAQSGLKRFALLPEPRPSSEVAESQSDLPKKEESKLNSDGPPVLVRMPS